MYRCVGLLAGGENIQELTSEYDILPRGGQRTTVASTRAGEIPAARLAAWRASKCGMVAVRTGRSFIEPPLGRSSPCRNLNYQPISGKTPKSWRTKYRTTNIFAGLVQGYPAP
ncbi:hypothetical protein RRG08_025090 [Elysia crispata]|uniref:Uncharacterized protein n=1 Tax=Elysia crispata TaxID=231223 RepID=A0AAE1AIN7_9GAST|nr:hypothetical protein RRG08_025090 [Elysia crispata]